MSGSKSPGLGGASGRLLASFLDPDDNYLEDSYQQQLDDLSSDEEKDLSPTLGKDRTRQPGSSADSGSAASSPSDDSKKRGKKEHWVDPERQVDKDLLTLCQGRLKRRAQLIDHIRNAYLSDVVLLKSIIQQNFSEGQIQTVFQQWQSAIPSLDLRKLFWLHAPDETTLAVIPCDKCGGSVELMHHDSPEIERLTKLVSMQENQTHDLKIMVATQKAKLESQEVGLRDAANSHLKEKQVMFGKMKDLRSQADSAERAREKSMGELKDSTARYEQLRADTADYRDISDARKKLQIENINLSTALDQKSDAYVAVSSNLSTANEEIMVLKKQAIANQTAMTKANTEIEGLTVSVKKISKVHEQAEARYEKAQGLLDDLKKEFAQVDSARNSLAIDLSVMEDKMTREIEQMEARQAALRAQNIKLTSDLTNARDTVDMLTIKLEMENPDSLNNVHEEEVFRLQDELDTAQAEIERLNEELGRAPLANSDVERISSRNSVASIRASSKTSAGAVTGTGARGGERASSRGGAAAARPSYSVSRPRKGRAPMAIVTKQSSDEMKKEEAAWASQDGGGGGDDEIPPPPVEVDAASFNDTPHPERLVKPFFQSFASEENDLVKEGSSEDEEDDFSGDDDVGALAEKKISLQPARSAALPPPTPKKTGGSFHDIPVPVLVSSETEGTPISPGMLPKKAAENRRKSIDFAEYARSDSITEHPEGITDPLSTESKMGSPMKAQKRVAQVKYKLVKKTCRKVIKVKRIMKVWVKKRRASTQMVEADTLALAERLAATTTATEEDEQRKPDSVIPEAAAPAEVGNINDAKLDQVSSLSDATGEVAEAGVVLDATTGRPDNDNEEAEASANAAEASPEAFVETDDTPIIQEEVALSRMQEPTEQQVGPLSSEAKPEVPTENPPVEASTETPPVEEMHHADTVPALSVAMEPPQMPRAVEEAEEEYLLEPPDDLEDYEEVHREIDVEEEVEEEEEVQEPVSDQEEDDDSMLAVVSSELSTDEGAEGLTPPKKGRARKSKKLQSKYGSANPNGTVNMPARREYVAVPKNAQPGQLDGGSSKVKIALPKPQMKRVSHTQLTHAPFRKIAETGLSVENMDPHDIDNEMDFEFDVAADGEGNGNPETAKMWGSVMTDLRKVLRQTSSLKGQHHAIKEVVDAVGPRLRALCDQYSKTQIALWRTAKAAKATCDFVSVLRPTVTGLLSTLSLPASVKKADVAVVYTSILQSRDRETKGVKVSVEVSRYASRDLLRPWAQGLDMDHEVVGALTESADLAILGNPPLNADGSMPLAMASVTATEFFGDDISDRSEITDRVIASTDGMMTYEKTAMKDINHLLLRYIEQARFKHVENLDKISELEGTIAERARLEKENKERIEKENIVEVKDDFLQSLLKDRLKLVDVQKALAAEKENVSKLNGDLTKVELELMNAEREMLKIPDLQRKLAIVSSVQTETQRHLADMGVEKECTLKELAQLHQTLDAVKQERDTLQQVLSASRHEVDRLEVELAGMTELQKSTTAAFDVMKEADFARLNKTVSVSCQHVPDKRFSIDAGQQTEFIYPPLTLRQRLGSAIPGSSSGREGSLLNSFSKQSPPLFPAVTISCPLESVNALSSSSVSRATTSVTSRRNKKRKGQGDASLFLSLSQSMNSLSDSRSRPDGGDIDAELNSLFGGQSSVLAHQHELAKTAATGSRNPQYTFGIVSDTRTVRTTGNQSSHRAIGLTLPLVAPTDDSSTASHTQLPLDSDRSLRSHLSVSHEPMRISDHCMDDDVDAFSGELPGPYSPEISMSNDTSRASTSIPMQRSCGKQNYIPPSSPIRPHPVMSYTEQLERSHNLQIASTKPQMNTLSPLILQGPRTHEDFIRQSPSHKNGGRGRVEAGINPISGSGLLSPGGHGQDLSADSVFSQGSGASRANRGSRVDSSKIITGIPGQDPMSVSAYRKFVGTVSTSHRNKNF